MEPTDSDIKPAEEPTDFASIETPEELRGHSQTGSEATGLVPALDRPRPPRSPIVPRMVWWWLAGTLGVVLVLVAGTLVYRNSLKVSVPGVVGLDIALARTNLVQVGLQAQVAEERFSSRPEGEVLSQSPKAGAELKRGAAVRLIVSAGTEEFPMPDIVGNGIALAKGTLESRGLVMSIEEVVSDVASGTVLGTVPAAGSMVRSGDVIRVSVSVAKPTSTGLEPVRMDGVSVLIDPAPVEEGTSDINLEVARRLRALLEASGCAVTVLRTGTDTSTADADRAQAAFAASATVGIGLGVNPSGPPGRVVTGPAASYALRSAVSARFSQVAPPSSVATSTADEVLSSFRGPWCRVILGSPVQRADETSFADPRWADEVARAIYGGLGEVYGRKDGQ